jgi:RNA polymerase sigma-70 factor (ECF subfamily)
MAKTRRAPLFARAGNVPIRGREAVARVSLSTKRFWPEQFEGEIGEVNGQAALIMREHGQTWSVVTIDVVDGRIETIWVMVNPEKLTRV